MADLRCIRIKDGFFVPKGWGGATDLVYDSGGRLTPESALLRGAEKEVNHSEPKAQLDPGAIKAAEYYDGTLLFLGCFQYPHFGHFITEGLARFWVLLEDGVIEENARIPANKHPYRLRAKLKSMIQPPSEQYVRNALNAFDLEPNRFIKFKKPVRAKEIIVPTCSVYMYSEVSQRHAQVTQKIAHHTAPEAAASPPFDQPVYLSRRLLKSPDTKYFGEEMIEEQAKSLGFRVVHTQHLSHKESVELFNRHDRFVGLIGSAFLNLLYRVAERPAEAVYLCADEEKLSVYRPIDDIMGVRGRYEFVCEQDAREEKKYYCDVEKSVSVLRDLAGAWA